MFLVRSKMHKAQSLIEYTVLMAVVIAALLLMQAIIKRGYSGGIKESADRMGDAYSPTNTTTKFSRSMLNDQQINEEINTHHTTATEVGIDQFIPAGFGYTPQYAGDKGAYNYTERLNQQYITENREETDSAALERFKWRDFQKTSIADFPDPYPLPRY